MMLTNVPPPPSKELPGPKCFFRDQSPCKGNLHEWTVRMMAKLDGTPTPDAPLEKTIICEKHYPDREDPKFLHCACRLCKGRKGTD